MYSYGMIKDSHKQKGSSHIVIIIILVIILLGGVGFVFWKNFIAKDDKAGQTAQSSLNTKAGTKNDTPKEIVYKTYRTDKHPVSFRYPNTWSLENAKADDSDAFVRSVDVKTDKGDKITFSVGNQSLGGLCSEVAPIRSTIDVVPTTLKTPKLTTLSFGVTKNANGSYEAIYGLTDNYTEIGDKKTCDNVSSYIFNSGNNTYMLMIFKGTKHFTSLDEAKKFVSSDEYGAIKKMILSLSY